jgi:cyanophycinase
MAKTNGAKRGARAAASNGSGRKARTKPGGGSRSGSPGTSERAKRSAAAASAGETRPSSGTPRRGLPRSKGRLIVIGGHEDKRGEKLILRKLAELVGEGKLVVATIASGDPGGSFDVYRRLFRKLGVRRVGHLHIESRKQVLTEPNLEALEGATGVFFTGGAQLRLTTKLGGTALCERVMEIYGRGGVVAGTSAGASVLSETMLVSGNGDESNKIEASLRLAPGLGLFEDAVIDQHFAERGRIGRLLGAVAQNPRMLGIGIDENTAIVVDGDRKFEVIGEGAVYVLDGFGISYTNVADEEEDEDRTMSVFDMRLHVLSQGDRFDLRTRAATAHRAKRVEEALAG